MKSYVQWLLGARNWITVIIERSVHSLVTYWGLNFCWWLFTTFWYVISEKRKKSCFFEIWKKNEKYVFSNTAVAGSQTSRSCYALTIWVNQSFWPCPLWGKTRSDGGSSGVCSSLWCEFVVPIGDDPQAFLAAGLSEMRHCRPPSYIDTAPVVVLSPHPHFQVRLSGASSLHLFLPKLRNTFTIW